MDVIYNNLELIVGVVGGLSFGGIMFLSKSKSTDNDLTRLYVKYKKHNDNINKSSKSII